jgi:ubiquinone/menaquinone biosynthesis C-methylase UbiE
MFKKKYLNIDENFYDFIKDTTKDKTAKKVSDFYQEAPFPSYAKDETIKSIIDKGKKNNFISSFQKFIGNDNKKILEVGSGTSQVSVFLGATTNNQIYAMDLTRRSLITGYNFAKKNNLTNVKFILADIFDDVIKDETFDYIFCSGVLHHTKNTEEAFKILSKYLKKDGYFVLGLYNSFGRFRTIFRQYIYKYISKDLAKFLDPYLRSINDRDSEKYKAWLRDQYIHPVERCHTYDEVIRWFKENHIDILNFIPSKFINDEDDYFVKAEVGSYFERIFEQVFMNFTKLGSEGGLYIATGKKN